MATSGVVEPSAEATSVSEEVVSAVAAARGRDPTDLDPLFEAIDPDALDGLYERDGFGRAQSSVRVEFTYCGCEVVVDVDGAVSVSEVAPEAP